jgi:superfamily II DNA or RNA helicase
MPLVYLPDAEVFFAWQVDLASGGLHELAGSARGRTELLTPAGRRDVDGWKLPLTATSAALARLPAATVETLPASLASWALASKLSLELVARERVVPTIVRRDGQLEARWAAALSGSEDAAKVSAIARCMPPAAHAVPTPGGAELDAWAPAALLRAYLDAVADALVREARGAPAPAGAESEGRAARGRQSAWDQRWQAALAGTERSFQPAGFAERTLAEDLQRWSAPLLGGRDSLRTCFRLELPALDGEAFALSFMLQSIDDPSLLVSAAEVWRSKGRSLQKLGRAFRDPQESLLEALGRAARLFPELGRALEESKPETLALDPASAWSFLNEGAAALVDAGFGVIVPAELTAAGQRRLRLRMRVGGGAKVAGMVSGAAGLGLDELLAVDWEGVIGDAALSARELAELAAHKAPLVRHRGSWVAIDPRELAAIRDCIARGPRQVSARQAVQLALSGETQHGELTATVAASGSLTQLLERLRQGASSELSAPSTFHGALRPYQMRGLSFLSTLASLGLGACLADDMGLGKTIQLLAFLLRRAELAETDNRPALLVAPTSVIGNWESEAQRFAPSLQIAAHYGAGRARDPSELPTGARSLVLTTYSLLRRDAALLGAVEWSVVALDEAQNIKNAASATAGSARMLRASHRFALTGTPVENRLGELWSILDFANRGLLGPLETFRREFAVPIERYGDEQAAARLRRIVSPFVLRRLKSDPTVISDLPEKSEHKVVCTLTREQATLYKAVVDEEMRRIEQAEGIERRGRVLALLTFLKQICNHPAQYLGESGPLAKRSGKLARATEMLEEAVAAGDKALVFTQFREMGRRLTSHFTESLGCEVAFLHGGTPKRARDELVRSFQEEQRGPRVFVLSLKAGGTGLNLTVANHVFHYDRWWNPAVEDQATDRAYRIGQKRAVQVHKLLSVGTIEEKIDRLLEQKRQLAAKVVGAGERWITELDNVELRELFALSSSAAVGADDDEDERVVAPDASPLTSAALAQPARERASAPRRRAVRS